LLHLAFSKSISEAIAPLAKRLALLEAKAMRMEVTLEQRAFAYMGVWREGKVYGPEQFVTSSGGIWHCNMVQTNSRPGDGDARWTLAVKGGAR
jgi:hypothetical protein